MAEKATVPKGAKQPEDHKPKADSVVEEDRVITVRGEEFTVPAGALDDFELLIHLRVFERDKDGQRLVDIFERLLGDDMPRALNLLRAESPRISNEAAAEFIAEFIGALDPNS